MIGPARAKAIRATSGITSVKRGAAMYRTKLKDVPKVEGLKREDGWVDMDVRWLLTRETVGAEHSVFGITVFPPGSKHDIQRHPHDEEFE